MAVLLDKSEMGCKQVEWLDFVRNEQFQCKRKPKPYYNCLLPFTVVLNGLATIVATQSWQLGAVSANSDIRCYFSIAILVVIAIVTVVVLVFFWFFSKMRFLPFLGSANSRFEFSKLQKIRIS